MSRRNVAPARSSEVAEFLRVPTTDDVTITGVSDDTRSVSPGDLFFCVRGGNFDPHLAAADIVAAGAVGLVVDREVEVPAGTAVIRVDDVRSIVGPVVSELLGRPSSKVTTIGVTGTNGKTSTTAFIAAILREQGSTPVVFGTLVVLTIPVLVVLAVFQPF